MTKILANSPDRQIVFGTYEKTAGYFGVNSATVRRAVDKNQPLYDERGPLWLDVLYDWESRAWTK